MAIRVVAQDCGNSSAVALELPQSCAKPSILGLIYTSLNVHRIEKGLQHWCQLEYNCMVIIYVIYC